MSKKSRALTRFLRMFFAVGKKTTMSMSKKSRALTRFLRMFFAAGKKTTLS
jgi:negative regulator of replication initiation